MTQYERLRSFLDQLIVATTESMDLMHGPHVEARAIRTLAAIAADLAVLEDLLETYKPR